MDSFINLAKQGMQAYESHQQGNDEDTVQDRRHHESPGFPDVDHDDVVRRATEHTGDSEESSFFSSALKHVTNRKDETSHSIDEEHVTNSHREAYERGNAGGLNSSGLGAAAAMQAMKMFTQGGGSSGGGQSQLISLAMSEATKLFNASGKSSDSEKQDTVNSAAMTMMKLVVQSKFSSGILGGSDKGGLGSLMGMAQKFM